MYIVYLFSHITCTASLDPPKTKKNFKYSLTHNLTHFSVHVSINFKILYKIQEVQTI